MISKGRSPCTRPQTPPWRSGCELWAGPVSQAPSLERRRQQRTASRIARSASSLRLPPSAPSLIRPAHPLPTCRSPWCSRAARPAPPPLTTPPPGIQCDTSSMHSPPAGAHGAVGQRVGGAVRVDGEEVRAPQVHAAQHQRRAHVPLVPAPHSRGRGAGRVGRRGWVHAGRRARWRHGQTPPARPCTPISGRRT